MTSRGLVGAMCLCQRRAQQATMCGQPGDLGLRFRPMTPVLETPSKVKEAIPEEGAAGARGQEPPGTARWVPTDECWAPC